jgi:hypothetical protein
VLPLHAPRGPECSCGDPGCASPGKHPRTRTGLKEATTDEPTVRHWWVRWPDANVGLRTGVAFDVLDADGDEGLHELEQNGSLPNCPTVITGHGGHFYIRPTGVGGRVEFAPGLDWRGTGSYVVAPPSRHVNGQTYRWANGCREPAEAPSWLRNLLAARTSQSAPAVGEAIPEGQRDATLASIAGTMRRRGLTEPELLAALQEVNARRCRPPLPGAQVAKIAASIVGYEAGPTPAPRSRAFTLEPLDLVELLAAEPEPVGFVHEPYVPAGRRVWAFGAAESGKSMWAMWVACHVSRADQAVLYVSEENPLDEDIRRLRRLRPEPAAFRFVSGSGVDLALPEHVEAVKGAAEGAVLIVFDTLSACWSGDENENAAIAALDRDALLPIVKDTGASVLVLDHTGHPQPFVRRVGASAGRGASAKGQKADAVLNFAARGEAEFALGVGKLRGLKKPPETLYRVVDTDANGLEVVAVGASEDLKVAEVADAMAECVAASGWLTTNALRDAFKGKGIGVQIQTEAMRRLEGEDPPRVRVGWETVDTGKGRQRAKVWRPAEETLGV